MKQMLLEWIFVKSLVETHTSPCSWNIASTDNTASSSAWASNTALGRSLMPLCEVGLASLSSAPHTAQHHQQPAKKQMGQTLVLQKPCSSHLRKDDSRVNCQPCA